MSKCRAFSELLGCAGLGLALAGCAGITYAPTPSVRPAITTQPSNQAVSIGQTATFSVVAAGTAPLSYQWQKNNANIAGATLSTYTTPATLASDNGATFNVMVTNSAGSATSASATLTVNGSSAIAITRQPVSQSVTIGQSATFSVTATSGTLPLNYQWQKNGANIAGATLSTYMTPATAASDNGATFDVIVTNSAGSVTSASATLTVNGSSAIAITTQPVSQSVTIGQSATFSVTATSGTLPLNYQWQKNNANIAGATLSTYMTPATVASDNGATFDVIVTNSAGSITSASATLTVSGSSAIAITTQPASQSVTIGQTATFSVTATSGTLPLNYQWRKNGANIAGATLSTYTTPATVTSDNGATFDVIVTNSAGSVTSASATLTVSGSSAIAITTQPVSQSVTIGQSATFSVTATSGSPPLSYQWQKNGAAIAAATSSSYTTPATTIMDGGEKFTVVVTDATGNLTSSAATLTVNPSPAVDVVTYHNDAGRTGQNTNEVVLTHANVRSATFGKIGFFAVDGLVDAQPLYLSNVP